MWFNVVLGAKVEHAFEVCFECPRAKRVVPRAHTDTRLLSLLPSSITVSPCPSPGRRGERLVERAGY